MEAKSLSNRTFLILAIFFASVELIASGLYIPSLPHIPEAFGTSITLVQLSVSMFILGISISRLTFGPISDAFGRKIPLNISLVFSLIGVCICLFSFNIYFLLLGRFVQGIGGGGTNILARVILRDRMKGAKLAEFISYFSMIAITLMSISPLFGGYLQHFYGWRGGFFVLVLYTMIAIIVGIFVLPETNQFINKTSIKLSALKTNFKFLLTHSTFIYYGFILLFGYGCMLAWLTDGSVVLQRFMKFTDVEFGWIAGLVGGCYLLSAFINGRVVAKVGIQKMLTIGASCVFIAGIVMVLAVAFQWVTPFIFIIPVMLGVFGLGMLNPNAFAAGITPFSKIAGIAVSVLGTIQILGGLLASAYISFAHDHTQLPIGSVFLVSGIVCLFLIRKIKRCQA